MGRYYNGDIEGKFWFALQGSDAPSRFGGLTELSFSFDEDDIDGVKEELKRIEDKTPMDKIAKYFETNTGWNEQTILDQGFTVANLSDYADHEIGTRILKCIEQNAQCNFWGQL
tara:strand:+ start:218 stop:559 length:342 start_codon:yes stop_codon:yes gene_type:complete